MSVSFTTARFSPEECLRDYLASGKSGENFARLVNSLGGLAYRTALHVTGDQGLAEESSQQVFMILNRKAEKLRNHPSLSAWVHRTARFEADKILRREIAHRRRLEKFTMENSSEIEKPQILSRENWRLLDEAIDRLRSKDRALILARFFEGKNFRQIASETNSSEAACKVRLRRVMDRMSIWLSRRGCTLSLTALASCLGTEWSRASPAVISQPLVPSECSSSFFQIPNLLTSMKISKMTAAGILLLIGAALAPSVTKRISGNTSKSSDSPVAASDRSPSKHTVSSSRMQSVEQLFQNYPVAQDRLEELYQKHPNLRPREMKLADGKNFLSELNLVYEAYAGKRKWLEPSLDISYQLQGRKDRDEKMIKDFFDERREFTDQIIAASKQSVLGSKNRYSIFDATPGAINASKAMDWLRLQFSQSMTEGDLEYSDQIVGAFLKLMEAGSRPPLVLNLWSSSGGQQVVQDLQKLANSGIDVSRYVKKVTQKRGGDFFIDSIRQEFAETISLFETAKQVTDREALSQYLSSIYGGLDPSKSENLVELLLLKDELAKVNYHDLQDDLALVSSGFVANLIDAQSSASLDQAVFQNGPFDPSKSNLSEGRKLLLDRFGTTLFSGLSTSIIKQEQARRDLIIASALQQARQAGEAPASLDELVPKYLPAVPVQASTGEPFSLDSETAAIKSPIEK